MNGWLLRVFTHVPLARLARIGSRGLGMCVLMSLGMLPALSPPASAAGNAWGSINNFDTVNDTGVECHGFEIEIDDARSTDITYTYDWNHYGVPVISQDNSNPQHPKVFVRYLSGKNPDGTWAAKTIVPTGPILPTMGHQFTDPSVNFGGEHFGVGYYGNPTAVKYSWLKDDGAGNLVFAGAVNISTPAFTYNPPPAPAVPAKVVAAIVPPPPPAPPVLEFGPASWIKEIKTTSHNANKVELRELVADDPGKPQPWANGEQPEVEVEWSLLQTEFAAQNGGKNGELDGAPEDLPGNDEVVTRRYEFYKYLGPIDAETGEAVADTVAADGIHGVGSVTYSDHIDPQTGEWVTKTVDLSKVVIVGDFVGAQMAGFDAGKKIGLIDHLQDGEINVPYVDRTIVVGGTDPIVTTIDGALPKGMNFDVFTGILSGTPKAAGTFTFTIHSTDAAGGDVKTTYNLTINNPNVPPPVQSTISTSVSPPGSGTTTGDGKYDNGTQATVVATPNLDYVFLNWTEGGNIVSTLLSYQFTANGDRLLAANFEHTAYDVSAQVQVTRGGFRLNRANGHYMQQVLLKNVRNAAITGPVSLVLDNLTANVSLFNKKANTTATTPAGSPYLDVTPGNLVVGASLVVTLEFANPANKNINYTTRVRAGTGPR